MIKKAFSLIAAMVLGISAIAAPLTPEQALNAARQSMSSGRMKAPAAPMSLAYTMLSAQQEATLYVFTPNGGTQKGFMIVAADDEVPALLGYSDEGTFDPYNIPSNVAYWLGQYSLYIEQMTRSKLVRPHRQMRRAADHAAISPICKTTWNQSSPYNNSCPTVGGQRCVTGCVATALAQVLKVQQWPDKGEGSKSYQFKVNNTNYTASFNFANTTFNWSSMLNSYTGSSTSTQKTAVATLMSALGVASSMNYSPDGSGASAYDAGAGLIQYMKYDKGIEYHQRDWYTAEQWDELIYGELAQGRAVYYDGDDGTVGHAFVCDGYSSNSYYHINWGWGGAYDGYFLLSNLYPEGQGIGGGSGDEGFNYGQGAMIKVVKAKSGSNYFPAMAFDGIMTTDKTTYSVTNGESIKITGSGTYSCLYNMSLGTLTDVTFGVELVNGDNVQYVEYGTAGSIEQLSGIGSIVINSAALPKGTWRMYPAIAPFGGSTWYHVFAPVAQGSPDSFDIEVTSTTVTVTPHREEVQEDEVSADLTSISPVKSGDKGIYPGHSYNVAWKINAPVAFSDTPYCVVFNSDYEIVTYTAGSKTTIAAGSSADVTFKIDIPSTTSAGKYYIAIATVNSSGNLSLMNYVYNLTIEEEPEPTTTVDLLTWTPGNGKDEGLYPGHEYSFTYSIYSPAAYNKTLYCILYGGSSVITNSAPITVSVAAGKTVQKSFTLTIPDDLTPGSYSMGLAYVNSDNYLVLVPNTTTVQIVAEPLLLDATLLSIDHVGFTTSEESFSLHQKTTSNLTFSVSSNLAWTNDAVIARLFRKDNSSGDITTYVDTDPVALDINANGSVTRTWAMTIGSGINTGQYLLSLCYPGADASTYNYIGQPVEIEVGAAFTGIENVRIDNGADGQSTYFTIQGVEVKNPGPGLYIKVTGPMIEKVIIK